MRYLLLPKNNQIIRHDMVFLYRFVTSSETHSASKAFPGFICQIMEICLDSVNLTHNRQYGIRKKRPHFRYSNRCHPFLKQMPVNSSYVVYRGISKVFDKKWHYALHSKSQSYCIKYFIHYIYIIG